MSLVGKNIDAFGRCCLGLQLDGAVREGRVIAHPLFGRGFVESITADGMEVLFGEGRKRMAMNRPETGA